MLKALEIFKSSIRSKKTLEIYTIRLEQFHKFSRIKNYDAYLKMDNKTIENAIMEYVIYLKKKIEKGIIGPNAIPQRIAPIELFMSQNDIMINTKKIHRLYPRKVKTKGELPYTLKDLQDMMNSTTKLRDKVLITFFASTGVRPEAIPDLRYRHLKEMDLGCMAVTIYEDDIEEYISFLTPECVKYLQKYLKEREFHGEKIMPETPLFRSVYRRKNPEDDIKPMAYIALKASMYDIIRRAGIRKKLPDSGMKHDKAQFGGFRKWFETALNNLNDVNPNVTEKLMGHRNDLRGTYYNPDIRVRFENFKKAIPDLTIDQEFRLRAEAKKKDEMIEKFEFESKNEIESVKRQLHEQQLTTLKLIGDAIKDPEKFKKMLLDKQNEESGS